MVAKRGGTRRPETPSVGAKRIIYATDTSATMPGSKRRTAESTAVSLDDYQSNETYDIEPPTSEPKPPNGLAILGGLLLRHWEITAFVLGGAATILIFATRLDAKVEVLSGDVKDMKTSVEKLGYESTRTSTEVIQLQKSVSRLEDQKQKK